MNYLVMECRPAYAVVLGDDGRMIKVANFRYEVGQTVTEVVELDLPETAQQPVKTNHRRWISSLAAMAACLALAVTSIFFTGQTPCASVYMTINPEVRIDVNRNDVVVGVEGMNPDGAELLEGYDHRRKDLDTVMNELVDRAIDMDYLHPGGTITLSLDADEEWVTSHGAHLNQHLNEHLSDRITVTVDVEQRQPPRPAPTAPAGTIVIPVGPDSYGESDYGQDAAGGESRPAIDGDSGYDIPDDGQTDYDSPDDGQTDYDAPSDEDDRPGQDAPTADDDDSAYDDAPVDDGDSAYDDAPVDDGQSAYDDTPAEDDPSGSDNASDDGQSDYDQSGDGDSAYEESDDD